MEARSIAFSKLIDISHGAREHFHVPKYQREYSWRRKEWEQLLADIDTDENPPGYFMGSLICVEEGKGVLGTEHIYQVIDGQQRLTSLSLLLMAIYYTLTKVVKGYSFADEYEEQDTEAVLSGLRAKLIKRKKDPIPGEPGSFISLGKTYFQRVQPSAQNHNLEDYRYILSEIGLLEERTKPEFYWLRRIYKGYSYFCEKMPETLPELCKLVQRIDQLTFVYIEVGSHADAFALFESLNNRGVPLSAIDIIKNKLLAEMDDQHKLDMDKSFEKWQKIINSLWDATEQERFLRHFYNAFRHRPAIRVDGVPRATKSRIIRIYEELIEKDASSIFDELTSKAVLYGNLLRPLGQMKKEIANELIELERIGASPAYQILLFLFSLPEDHLKPSDFLRRAVKILCLYYIRRNLTDVPATRNLDQLSVELVDACSDRIAKDGVLTFDTFATLLLNGKGKPASIEDLRTKLEGPIYAESANMTRYLLIQIDLLYQTREYKPEFWERDVKERFVWTIEHVLPQAEKLPEDWVKMLAHGDVAEASRLQAKHVDQLGNLTLSAYNRELSTSPLVKKQTHSKKDPINGQEIYDGYLNGLALNNLCFEMMGKEYRLATAPEWTAAMIEARTKVMVDLLIETLKLPGETIHQEAASPLAVVS